MLRVSVAYPRQGTVHPVKMCSPHRHGVIVMDESQMHSSEDIDILNRILQLTSLRDWCMERLSVLSLRPDLEDARCLTSEHLEMLAETNAWTTLWVPTCWRAHDDEG
jgi:hypothetical protein